METLEVTLKLVQGYATPLSLLGAAAVFIFSAIKFLLDKRTELFWKEFDVYHRLVQELVEPADEGKPIKLDRQCAIIFELRNFKRYYPHSCRMLKGLQDLWCEQLTCDPRISTELNLTIEHIENKNNNCFKKVIFVVLIIIFALFLLRHHTCVG